MARKLGGKRLTGKNPLAYLGVEASSPSNFLRVTRAPTINDTDHQIGTVWLHEKDDSSVTNDVYILVDIDNALNSMTTPPGPARWIMFGAGSGDVISLTGDTGGAVFSDDDQNINILGDHGINTAGTPASNQLDVAINNTITLGDLSDVSAGTAALTVSTGDLLFSATNNVGNINLPNTHSSGNAGVIEFNGIRHLHNYSPGSINNIFLGHNAGNFTYTGGTQSLTGIGQSALSSVTTGTGVAVGTNVLSSLTSGTGHVAIGLNASQNITSADGCVSVGSSANQSCTTGEHNVGVGYFTLNSNTTGDGNIALGSGEGTLGVLWQLDGGNYNIAIGSAILSDGNSSAGSEYTGTESSNILIGSKTIGTAGESNTMRLGTNGSGDGQINRCFIAGIRGVTTGVADAVAVLIDSAHQLGTASSSIRVKKNIEDMASATDALFDLRPVNFDYIDSPSDRRQYGLIAEEVERVMPDLVVYDKGGNPESVRYHELPIMILNELKKLKKSIDDIKTKISQM